MRRVRVLFIVCALALTAPVLLLVRRALDGVALEAQLRQQAVAERVFDELERSLSRVLEREEARPFENYGATRPAEASFLVGAFQVEPGGGIAIWPVSDAPVATAPAELERLLGRYWRGAPAESDRLAGVTATGRAQSPGTTVALEEHAGAGGLVPQTASSDAYDALRSLNKAVAERAERPVASLAPQQARPQSRAGEPERADERGDETRQRSADGRGDLALADASTGRAKRDAAATDLPPLSGRLIDARHLMLYRTVVRGREAYRQGVLLDVPALGEWLRAQALGDEGLARNAELAFWTPPGAAPALSAAASFVYQHRFAEPFDDLSARLGLRPLPGAGSAGDVYTLSALLLAVGALGLLALYRMVSVTVRSADQRTHFVAAVSHELKTPLTAIRMYAEMLRDGMVPSESKRAEYHRHITVESERLSRLIDNVLELGRLEKGGRDVVFVSGSLGPVLTDVAELLGPHVQRAGFELAVETEPDLPAVRFDRDALVQVLCNLVDNAVKYARDAALRRIELRAWRDGADVCLAVRDHGPGVAPRHLGRIFEPFYRGESALTRRHPGSGIGLALVRGLIGRMGARVSARNPPGGGFEVELRFAV